jgi:hypothetical protein
MHKQINFTTKIVSFSILSILFLTNVESATAQGTLTDYDKFTDESSMITEPVTVDKRGISKSYNSIKMSVGFRYKGKTPYVPKYFIIIFAAVAPNSCHFDANKRLIVLAGEERINLGEMKKRDRTIEEDALVGYLCHEVYTAWVDYKSFEKMVNSNTVEMRAGESEFKLKDKHLLSFREFFKLVASYEPALEKK